MPSASILLIGSELLSASNNESNGRIVLDFLEKRNFEIKNFQIVEDDKEAIKASFENAIKVSDIVISSGGIGPTGDDLTREGLSLALGKNLIINKKWLKEIEKKLLIRNKKIKECDRKMAYVPEGGMIIPNKYGLAGGVFFTEKDKFIFLLPGVPSEFKEMFESFVCKKIDKNFKAKKRSELKVTFAAIRESEIQEYLKNLDRLINLKYSILPHFGVIDLKILFENEEDKLRTEKKIFKIFKSNIISINGNSLVDEIKKEMFKRKIFLSVAESLTGGNISKKVVSVSGASEFFKGSVTAYSNEAKIEILGVPEKYIQKYGAVSEEVALAMARGVRARFLSQCAIATTGIAGPSGGSRKKPVGLVYIAVSKPHKERVYRYIFPLSREGVIEMTSNYALYHFLQLIKE
ncbi:MAG: nicotinamide-nucleotide amidohydrolase family protein [Acidobacteria bacterium]|nr:nicotinamide-nucleotide amidohydrolase family protein [Acidobacteriota bacterium]